MNKLKNFFDVTMIKFILVGIVNTAVGMGTMFICYNFFHLSYWISSASNYVVGSIVSYFLNKYFTFQNKSKSMKTVIKFVINITVCYLVAYGVANHWPFGHSVHLTRASRTISQCLQDRYSSSA